MDIQVKRGSKAELDAYGPLKAGEFGLCLDTGELFVGTGSENVLVNKGESATNITISDVEPTNPAIGDVWIG